MKSLRLLFVLLSLSFGSWGQNGLPPDAGGRSAGMAGADVIFQDVFSLFSNQAGLAFVKNLSIGVLGEQRFLLPELQTVAAGVALPTNAGTFGLQLGYFGFRDYNEQKIGLAYARKLGKNLAIGAQFDYLNTRITESGSQSLVTFELGALMRISDQLRAGVHLFSPARIAVLEDEFLPTRISAGIGYQPASESLLAVELEQQLDGFFRVKGGIDYQIIDILSLRIGGATNPALGSFGLGLDIQEKIRIDFATQYHLILGWTPAIGLSYSASKS